MQASIDELRSKNEKFAGLLRSAERDAAKARSDAAVHQAHRAELSSKVERLDREVARLQSLADSTEAELGRARAALLTSETKAARVDCQKQFIEALRRDLTNATKRIERLEKDLRNERRRPRTSASASPKPAQMADKSIAAPQGAGGRETRQQLTSPATRKDEPGTEVTTGGDTT